MLLHLSAPSLGFYPNFILIAWSARQLKCSTFHPIPSVYNQEPFPVSGVKDRARAQGLWVECCLQLSGDYIFLLVGTGLSPDRQFEYMLFACFLSLRLLMLFIDPFPFYPRPISASLICWSPFSGSAPFISSGLSFSP